MVQQVKVGNKGMFFVHMHAVKLPLGFVMDFYESCCLYDSRGI